MNKIKFVFVLLVAIFAIGITMPGCTASPGSDAPEVNAQKWLNAESFSLAENKDKIIIVEFWATWCPPCRASIPHLKTLHETYKDKGVVLVSLSNEPNSPKITKFCNDAGMNWIVGLGSTTGSDYGVSGIPHAFIVVNGKIVWKGHPMAGLDEEIKKIVDSRPVKAE
ncbi:MAG: TlpA disulfide reductase family protein [Candidatus Riflebacteria bacterium]|nr:TlpA disulfide reductase family protein [Candidatus Riflebacteria bacterium]